MSNTIRTAFLLQNVVSNTQTYGGLPNLVEEVTTDSEKMHQTVQVVGTTHELISAGDVPDDAMCIIRNLHASAVVSVGVEVAATFYPLVNVPAGETAKLSRLEAVAGTYLKSTAANTEVLVSLYEIVVS